MLVRSPRGSELVGLLAARGATVTPETDGGLAVTGIDPAAIGDLALSEGIAVHELTPRNASLEEAFMELTADSVEYRAEPATTAHSAGLTVRGALRAVLGAALYMLIVTLIGVGLGAIIRHTAGAISALFGLVLVLPQLVIVLPQPWNSRVQRLLPELHSVITQHPVQGLFSPAVTLLVCAAWAVAALGTAGFLSTRRDA